MPNASSPFVTIETPEQYHELVDQGRVITILKSEHCQPCNRLEKELSPSVEVSDFLIANNIRVLYVDCLKMKRLVEEAAFVPMIRVRVDGQVRVEEAGYKSPAEFINFVRKSYSI